MKPPSGGFLLFIFIDWVNGVFSEDGGTAITLDWLLLEESETSVKFTPAGAAQSAWLSFADRVASCLVSFLATATDDNRNLPSRLPRSQRTRPDEPDRSMAER